MTQLRGSRLRLYIAVVLLALGLVALHTYHFAGRNYRQDEAWVVHGVLQNDVNGILAWMSQGTHPPGYTLTLNVWVELFGHTEAITRYLSALLSLLSLSLLFRLARELFDWQVGLWAMLLLGTLNFFVFFTHEVRPYAMLSVGVIATQLFFLSWLRQPNRTHALLFLVAGIFTAYIHFYGVLFIMALALYFILFIKIESGRFWHTLAIFTLIGVAFLPWALVVLGNAFLNDTGGVNYALSTEGEGLGVAVNILYEQMQMKPPELGVFLLLTGLLVPLGFSGVRKVDGIFRGGVLGRKLYIIAIPILIILIAFISNVYVNHLTPRNMIVILPPLAILAALAMRMLYWQAQVILLALILIPAFLQFEPLASNGPYLEVAQAVASEYDESTRLVIDGGQIWQHIPLLYYLDEQIDLPIPEQDSFHLWHFDPKPFDTMPRQPTQFATGDSQSDRAAFREFTEDAERVLYVEVADGVRYEAAFVDTLMQSHTPVGEQVWTVPEWDWPHRLVAYRRIPDDVTEIVNFGGALAFQSWQLLDSVEVTPCQTIRVESWWQADDVPEANYSMTLVLANSAGNGIAQSDGSPAEELTQLWQPERFYLDERTLTIPCGTSSGDYNLLVGIYDPEALASLPAINADGDEIGNLFYLTTIRVGE